MVGVVDDEAARGDAMVPQDAPHTGHRSCAQGLLRCRNSQERAAIAYVPRLARAKRAQHMAVVTSTAVRPNASQVCCVTASA